MFQRRMIQVASRLQNTQLHAPQLFSSQKKQQQPDHPQHGDAQGDATAIGQGGDGAIATERISNFSRQQAKIEFDTIALNLRNKSLTHRRTFFNKIRQHFIYWVFLLYLLAGTLFYMFDPGNEVHGILAYYQAITIGFSVGLGTKDPSFLPNVWFSSLYILCGASIIAVMLTAAGNQVEEKASLSMFESLQRRESYENQMSRDKPLKVRLYAFLAYNSAYLISIFVWLLWMGFIMCWAMLQVPEWSFGQAQYFAVSLCSSAGSFSLPTTASNTAYGLAGVSMMIGVPLMAMGVSSIIIMFWQGHRFQKVKEAAWDDVTQEELKLLNELGVVEMGEGDELTKGGFILLGLLRMGQEVGVMKYLADAFEAIEDRGGVIIRQPSADNDDGNRYYSKHAHAYVSECSKDEVDEMQDFTSINSSHLSDVNTATSLPSTADTSSNKRARCADERSWSVSVGVDNSRARLFSGLSAILSGGSDDDDDDKYVDEALTSTERQENDSGTFPISDSIKSKDTWASNNP